jgi:hypothetical protein
LGIAESVAKCWLCNKKYGVVNMLSSGGLLKLRNSLCFREANWVDMKMLWQQVILVMRYWHVLVPLKETDGRDGSAPWAAPGPRN